MSASKTIYALGLLGHRRADVLLSTDLSVDGLAALDQEKTFLCPSTVEYARPLRALNSRGQWSVVVNDIPASYDRLTQTVRIERCKGYEQPCRLLPDCYQSKCVQKYAYHRFLVYNPKDYYYPFRVESFKLPSSCDCTTANYEFHPHHHHHGYDNYQPASPVSYLPPSPTGKSPPKLPSFHSTQPPVKKKKPAMIYAPLDSPSPTADAPKVPHYIDKSLG